MDPASRRAKPNPQNRGTIALLELIDAATSGDVAETTIAFERLLGHLVDWKSEAAPDAEEIRDALINREIGMLMPPDLDDRERFGHFGE